MKRPEMPSVPFSAQWRHKSRQYLGTCIWEERLERDIKLASSRNGTNCYCWGVSCSLVGPGRQAVMVTISIALLTTCNTILRPNSQAVLVFESPWIIAPFCHKEPGVLFGNINYPLSARGCPLTFLVPIAGSCNWSQPFIYCRVLL